MFVGRAPVDVVGGLAGASLPLKLRSGKFTIFVRGAPVEVDGE